MAVIAQLLTRLGLDSSAFDTGTSRAKRSLRDLTAEATRSQRTLAMIAKGAAGFYAVSIAARAAYGAISSVVSAAVEGEKAQVRLNSALKFSAGATKAQIEMVNALVEQMSRLTLFTREELRDQMAYAASIGVTADQMKELTEVAIGLSTVTGKDLQHSTMVLRAGMEGNIARVRDLGITISATMTKQEAWSRIIQIGTDGFKQATEAAKSNSGAITQTGKDWHELKERMGEVILPPLIVFLDTLVTKLDDIRIIVEATGRAWSKWSDFIRFEGKGGVGAAVPFSYTGAAAGTYRPAAPRGVQEDMIAKYRAETGVIQNLLGLGAGGAGAGTAAPGLGPRRGLAAAAVTSALEAQGLWAMKQIEITEASEKLDKMHESMVAQADAARVVTGNWKQTKQYAEAEALALKAANGDLEKHKMLMDRIATDQKMIENAERLKTTYDSMSDAWKSTTNAMLWEGMRWAEGLKNLARGVVQEMINILVIEKAARAFAGGVTSVVGAILGGIGGGVAGGVGPPKLLPSGATGFPIYHSGGIVPRLHNGYGPDEFPAILQRGETVIPRGGLQSTVNIINQTGTPVKGRVTGGMFDGRKYVTSILLEDMSSNGPIAQAMGA